MMIPRYALAFKTLPGTLQQVLTTNAHGVNFIRAKLLNRSLPLPTDGQEMGREYEYYVLTLNSTTFWRPSFGGTSRCNLSSSGRRESTNFSLSLTYLLDLFFHLYTT